MKTCQLMGFDVTTQSASEVVSESLSGDLSTVVNTINPHSYIVQKSDKAFEEALLSSDVLIPDGSGIVLAAKVISGKQLTKIAGFDLFIETLRQLNKTSGKIFLLGSTQQILALIKHRVQREFPNIQVESLSPPFKEAFSEDDIVSFCAEINSFSPDVIFVGLTAPKQEKLINILKNRTNSNFLAGIGAVFDFYAGTVKRPSRIWVKLHLEWFIRLLGEPKRLWRRNFISTPLFLLDIILHKFKKEKTKFE